MKIYEHYPSSCGDFDGLVFTDRNTVPLYWVDDEIMLGVHTRDSFIKHYESFSPDFLHDPRLWYRDGEEIYDVKLSIREVIDRFESLDPSATDDPWATVGWTVGYDTFWITRLY